MASIEFRSGRWRVVFRHNGDKHAFTIGEVDAETAENYRSSTDELLRLLKRNLVAVPPGLGIEDFMFHRGKPPEHIAPNGQKLLTLESLREAYLRSQERKLEPNTIEGIRLHFSHLIRILGGKIQLTLLKRASLQRYVDRR